MTTHIARPEPQRSGRLHPVIYKIMIGLAVVLVVAAWSFFRHGGPTALVLTVVTIFFVVALGIPYELSRIARRNDDPAANASRSYRDWKSCEFGICQDHVKGRSAAIEALLPIAAAAFAMVAFAIALTVAV